MSKKVVKVSRTAFQMEDGAVFPISPPLGKDMSVKEFQRHYERVNHFIRGCKDFEDNSENVTSMGQGRQTKNS